MARGDEDETAIALGTAALLVDLPLPLAIAARTGFTCWLAMTINITIARHRAAHIPTTPSVTSLIDLV